MFLVVLVIGFNLIPAHLNLSRAPMYKVQITVLIHKINVCKIIWLKKVDTWTDFFLKYLHFLHSVQSKIRLELVSDPVFLFILRVPCFIFMRTAFYRIDSDFVIVIVHNICSNSGKKNLFKIFSNLKTHMCQELL